MRELPPQKGEPEVTPLAVTLAEAGRLLSIGRTKLNELANSREIERVHIGKRALITVKSLHAYVARLTAR